MPSPYIPNTNADREAMLKEIGVRTVDALFADVPKELYNVPFQLPSPLSELELKKELEQLAAGNATLEEYTCFLGGGYYRHYVPSVIEHLTGRSEFYTAYTPYQAEASQGILQAIYEYQSLACQLTGMEVSNAGMYDGSTAAAEAALMACRITGRKKVAVASTVNAGYLKVIDTYTKGQHIQLTGIKSDSERFPSDCACLVAQQPNFFGYFEDLKRYSEMAHKSGALLIAIVDPISLGLFQTPAKWGADILVAEGQSLGNPINFGGPGLGIFTCRQEYLRQIPGRIVGKTVDLAGRPGYVLTLATREQHIRRERATSNICTNETLVAVAAAIYLACLGKIGLRQVAELCYHKAHYAAEEINKLKGFSLVFPQPFFKEFVIRCPVPPDDINQALFREKMIGGLDISETIEYGMLFCVTELNTRQEIDKLASLLKAF